MLALVQPVGRERELVGTGPAFEAVGAGRGTAAYGEGICAGGTEEKHGCGVAVVVVGKRRGYGGLR